VGQLVLDAEAGRRAPVPVGLINGSIYRGGQQPPLDPLAVINALQQLLGNPGLPDAEIVAIAGGAYSVTGCEISGDVAGLLRGLPAAITETGRITITDVPVPARAPERPSGPGKHVLVAGAGRIEGFLAHLVIESLPGQVATTDVVQAIAGRAQSRPRRDFPELAERTGLPVADIAGESGGCGVSIQLKLSSGSDPAEVRERLREVDGIAWSSSWQFPAPLAAMLRSWVERHRAEDLQASLTQLEQAVHDDWHRGSSRA
jgi:hypothetical protein